jgi:hypothetical protein
MHPDPAGLEAADPSNPQSWNRYAYVSNDPLSSTDPLGLCPLWQQEPEMESEGAPMPMMCLLPPPFPVPPAGGGGPPPSTGGGSGATHGPWPGNQTTGLPQLPTQPLSLGDLLGMTPGNGFTQGAAVLPAFVPCLANPACATIAITVTAAAVVGIVGYEIYIHTRPDPIATTSNVPIPQKPCNLIADPIVPGGIRQCIYKCVAWPGATVHASCKETQTCAKVIPGGWVTPETACQ